MSLYVARTVYLCAVLFIATLLLSSCQTSATIRAEKLEAEVVSEICKRWTPITDTSSEQTRRLNRGRYALCETN